MASDTESRSVSPSACFSVLFFSLAYLQESPCSSEEWRHRLESRFFLANGLAFAAAAFAYVFVTGRGLGYVDVSVPTARTIALGVGLGVLVFSVQGTLDGMARLAGVSMGTDQAAAQVTGDATILLAAIAINLLLIGPAEELFFRNVLQKRLAEKFRVVAAIVLVSLLFAPLHVGNFGGESVIAIGVSLVAVFFASVIYGFAFAWFERLELVAIGHGVQNSITLLVVYAVF